MQFLRAIPIIASICQLFKSFNPYQVYQLPCP